MPEQLLGVLDGAPEGLELLEVVEHPLKLVGDRLLILARLGQGVLNWLLVPLSARPLVPFFIQGLAGLGETLFRGPKVLVLDAAGPGLKIAHLGRQVGIVNLERLQVFQELAQFFGESVRLAGDAVGDLPLDDARIGQVVPSGLVEMAGILQRAARLGDGRDGLALHLGEPGDQLADLALIGFKLAGDLLRGDDPQAQFAALAQVRAVEIVPVAGVGVERDDRARLEAERRKVPGVVVPVLLDRGGLGSPEGDDLFPGGRLGALRRGVEQQPHGAQTVIVLRGDGQGNLRVSGHIAVIRRLLDGHPGGLVLEGADLEPGGVGLRVREALGILQVDGVRAGLGDRQGRGQLPGIARDDLQRQGLALLPGGPQGGDGNRLVGLRRDLDAAAQHGLDLGAPGASCSGGRAVYSGGTTRSVSDWITGGGTTWTARGREAVVARGDREGERLPGGLDPGVEMSPRRLGTKPLGGGLAVGEVVADARVGR